MDPHANINLGDLVTVISPANADERRVIHEPMNGEFAAMRLGHFLFKASIPVGNHIHLRQEEIFFVSSGKLIILVLENVVTKERRVFKDLGIGTRIHIPAGIAHALIFEPGSTMTALSSKPFDPKDLYPYQIMGPNGELLDTQNI
jgi:quercetin dioxygenase-like cupin family protein